MTVFRMPSLGADMEAGLLVEWLIAPGDVIKRGDIVAVVETQKGAIEIEIFQTGKVDRLVAEIGDELPVGAPMAEIYSKDETSIEPATPPLSTSPSSPKVEPGIPMTPPRRPAQSVPGSPAARRRAIETKINLDGIKGTGPGGAIRLADVEQAITAPGTFKPVTTTATTRFDPAPMRKAIAAAMERSKREIPHYYLSHEIDLQIAADWLKQINAARAPNHRFLMGALLVRASALAARKVPQLNGTFDQGTFTPSIAVNIGIAVSLRGGGLVAPALHNADTLPVDELMAQMRELVSRARFGRLRSSEISDPTITVSSLGDRGVDNLQGVIFPPQVAIIGFGAPRLRPVVFEGEIIPRLVVGASLSADHRVSDGRQGARFLTEISRLLQTPEAL